MTIRNLGWLASVALMVFGASASVGHDFGGPSGASPPPSAPPLEPCNSCPCAGPPGGKGNGPQLPSSRTGKPISAFNGGESIVETDLTVPGEFPITLTRKYDSQSTFDSPLGAGWSFMASRSLYEYTDGSIVVRHGCGSRDRYVLSGGSYASPVGGMLGTLTAVAGGYELRYSNGVTDYFDNLGRLTAVRDAKGNRHEYTYDARGKLPLIGVAKASVDPTKPVTVAYVQRITRIDERGVNGVLTGRYVTFQYNETTGRLTSVTANDGRTVSYVQDVSGTLTKGNLVQVNMLDGQVATYGYTDANDPHNLTSVIEAAGRTPVVNVYDANDRVITQTEGTRRLDFNYQTPFVRTIVTRTIVDQNGLNPYTTATTYEFDTSGRVTKIVTPLGHEQRYAYDASALLTRKEIWQKTGAVLAMLQAVNFTYDTQGHKSSEWLTLDSGETITKSWTYDHDWVASEQVVSSSAPSKLFRTEFTFNYGADGRPVSLQSVKRRKDDGSFQTTAFTYDARNRPLTTVLPDGVKQVYQYTGDFVTHAYFEVAGAPIAAFDERFEYDGEGKLIKRWDARNNLTQFDYDDRGRMISRTNPLGEKDLWTYTNDRLTQVEHGQTVSSGEGQITKYLYDARARLVELQRKNDAGAFITWQTFAYDSESQPLRAIDALNRATATAYDLDGRAASLTDPLNKVTQFFYDAAGNRTRVRDALVHDTDVEFDDLNRVTATVEMGIAPNVRTEMAYDAAGNLLTVKDGEDRITSYQYDALSRNTAITQPLGQQVQFVYDNRDRLDYLITAKSQKLDYAYEAWGPFKEEKQFPTLSAITADRTIAYARDNDGNVTSITDSGIQTGPSFAITFDSLNRPYDETVKYLPGGDRVLQHRYDRYGHRNQISLTGTGATSSAYSFDKLNRLASATLGGAAVSLSYFANDDLQTVTLPNSVTRSYTYKANGPIDTITVAGLSGQIAQFSYAYDDAKNVDTQTDFDGLHDYSYDGLNRLTQATHPAPSGLPSSESFTYSAVGDRKDPANQAAWVYDANHRISNSPGLTYTFDAAGNLQTRSDSVAMTYDARQRLIQVVKSGVTSNYIQDPFGRRIKKQVGGVSSWFLWDRSSLLAEFDAAGLRTKRYAYLSGLVATQVEDTNGIYYAHADQLNTPRLLTKSAGQVVWRSRQEAFGKATVQEDPDGNGAIITFNTRLPGQYFDLETGLHYNYFRDYDPAVGRYAESDPIGLAGGLNTFRYAGANPVSYSDPRGLNVAGVNPFNPCSICHNGVFPAPILPGAPSPSKPWEWNPPEPKPIVKPKEPKGGNDDDCDDECDQILEMDTAMCNVGYLLWDWNNPDYATAFRGRCMARAFARWSLCKKNGGQMPPNAPSPWSDFDEQGFK